MGVHFDVSQVHDLADDFEATPSRASRTVGRTVGQVARRGNILAKRNARESSGKHGKHYPKAFEAERTGLLSWEYGPLASRPQGGMAFETGSRNQPPHLDIARSADAIDSVLEHDVADALEGVFGAG